MTTPTPEELLAQWLDDPAAGPPKGLDDEVVQAMIALRPELAPAPTIGLDDILAGVSEGPFARRSELPVSTISDEELEARRSEMPISQAEIVDLAAARKRRNRIWGAVGTMAAAALVLVVVIPQSGDLSEAPELSAPSAKEALNDAQPTEQATEQATMEAAEGEADAAAWEEPIAPPAPAAKPTPEDGARELELKTGAGESSYGAPPEPVAEEASVQAIDSLSGTSTVGASTGWEDDVESGDGDRYADAGATETTASPSPRQTRSPSKKKSSGRFGGLEPSAAAPKAAEATVEEDSFEDFDFEEEAAPAKSEPPTDLNGLRAAATPRDYDPNWYLRVLNGAALDDFAATIDTAEARAAVGDYAGAALACRELADNTSDPRVRQDMYGRAAAWNGSLTDVRKGQKVSSANTAFLARLYALEGQLLETQGDVEGAKKAYRTAANLNAAR